MMLVMVVDTAVLQTSYHKLRAKSSLQLWIVKRPFEEAELPKSGAMELHEQKSKNEQEL